MIGPTLQFAAETVGSKTEPGRRGQRRSNWPLETTWRAAAASIAA